MSKTIVIYNYSESSSFSVTIDVSPEKVTLKDFKNTICFTHIYFYAFEYYDEVLG